jgi:hypothetical protein
MTRRVSGLSCDLPDAELAGIEEPREQVDQVTGRPGRQIWLGTLAPGHLILRPGLPWPPAYSLPIAWRKPARRRKPHLGRASP